MLPYSDWYHMWDGLGREKNWVHMPVRHQGVRTEHKPALVTVVSQSLLISVSMLKTTKTLQRYAKY